MLPPAAAEEDLAGEVLEEEEDAFCSSGLLILAPYIDDEAWLGGWLEYAGMVYQFPNATQL